MSPYQALSQLAFGFRRRSKIDFQDDCCDSHLGFPISTMLAHFDLQGIAFPSTVNWSFSSGVEVQNRFSRWQSWKPTSIFQDGNHGSQHRFLIETISAVFYLQAALILCTMFRFHSGEVRNRFSKDGHLGFWILHRNFVCVEVLRPSQPNGVMLSAVSLLNHMFTGQA